MKDKIKNLCYDIIHPSNSSQWCKCDDGEFKVVHKFNILFNRYDVCDRIIELKRTCKFQCEDGCDFKPLYEKYGRKWDIG